MKKHIICLGLLLWVGQGMTATFCAKTTTQIQDALIAASNNGEDDEIRIEIGDYLTPNNNQFNFSNGESFDLSISGGWLSVGNLDCVVQRTYPLLTTLDGNNSSRVLIYGSGGFESNLTVSNLSIINGFTTVDGLNGGLGIYINNTLTQTGEVLVDQVYFAGNESPRGSALRMGGGYLLTVRNSVFENNTANGEGSVRVDLTANSFGLYFINNTLLNNQTNLSNSQIFNTSGLFLSLDENAQNAPQALVANNLFWDNENSDLYVGGNGGVSYLYNNNYERGGGSLTDVANNMSLPPMLSSTPLDFTPSPDSPLIDSGYGPFPEIVPLPFEQSLDPGVEDFDDGAPLGEPLGRIINLGIDIGAVEAPEKPIFKNGFE